MRPETPGPVAGASNPERDAEPERSASDGGLPTGRLVLLALVVLAIPTVLGYLALRSDDDPSPAETSIGGQSVADQGMSGGGMGGGDAGGDQPTGGASSTAGVGEFSEIQATDIVIEPDPAGGGAVLRVTTTIDAACAVSYGPTPELGQLATDTDMAGGGHSDHHPLMGGLVPGTTYWYRLSAIGPDGRLYQSELMSFDHDADAAAVTPQPPAPNVADMARVSDVSSEYSDAFAARHAIDGDLSTEWSSAGDGDDAFVVLEFPEDMQLSGVGFRTRQMTDGTSITTSFSVNVDGRDYGPFESGPGLAIGLIDTVGQVVRFDVETSTGGNTGAVEVEVYGQTDM